MTNSDNTVGGIHLSLSFKCPGEVAVWFFDGLLRGDGIQNVMNKVTIKVARKYKSTELEILTFSTSILNRSPKPDSVACSRLPSQIFRISRSSA